MKSFLQVSILCLVSAGNVAWGTVVFSVKFPRTGPWGLVPHRAHQKLLERPVACGGRSQRFRFQWSGQGPWEFVLLMPLKLLQCAARVENQRSQGRSSGPLTLSMNRLISCVCTSKGHSWNSAVLHWQQMIPSPARHLLLSAPVFVNQMPGRLTLGSGSLASGMGRAERQWCSSPGPALWTATVEKGQVTGKPGL